MKKLTISLVALVTVIMAAICAWNAYKDGIALALAVAALIPSEIFVRALKTYTQVDIPANTIDSNNDDNA